MEEIESLGGTLDLVVTLEDDQAVNKSGRIWLDDFTARHGNALVKCRNVNDEAVVAAIKNHAIDWLFIIGWSQIARTAVLEAPTRGVLGMHPTLLPQGRGRAAIPWAILKGLPETGVTLFKLDEGVDTGPIVSQVRLPLHERETAATLYSRVSDAHRTLIRETWPDLRSDTVRAVPQDENAASEWPARTPADGEILPTMTLMEVDRLVRATTHPYPGAFLNRGDSILRIWAGRPYDGSRMAAHTVVIPCVDGMFAATDFVVAEHVDR